MEHLCPRSLVYSSLSLLNHALEQQHVDCSEHCEESRMAFVFDLFDLPLATPIVFEAGCRRNGAGEKRSSWRKRAVRLRNESISRAQTFRIVRFSIEVLLSRIVTIGQRWAKLSWPRLKLSSEMHRSRKISRSDLTAFASASPLGISLLCHHTSRDVEMSTDRCQ